MILHLQRYVGPEMLLGCPVCNSSVVLKYVGMRDAVRSIDYDAQSDVVTIYEDPDPRGFADPGVHIAIVCGSGHNNMIHMLEDHTGLKFEIERLEDEA